MEQPQASIRADSDERPPAFDDLVPIDDLVAGERTRDDFFDAVLGLDSPATASEVADRAGVGVDAAREYLAWFERLGVVTKVTDSPATYERNQAYLRWRRVQTLQREHTTEELLDHLQTTTDDAEAYAAAFDAATPDDVSITGHAAETDQSVEEVWERLSAWRTARRRIELLERAINAGDGAEQQSAV
jgi:predicted ArsR family transcriptional regulator